MRGWKIRNNFFGDSQSVGAQLDSVICGNTGSVTQGWKQGC